MIPSMDETKDKEKKKNIYEQVKESEKKRKSLQSTIKKSGRSVVSAVIYYSLPLFSIGVFFAIVFAGTVPSIKGIQDSVRTIEEKEEEIADLDDQIASLQDLKSQEAQMENDLAIIDRIVPSEKTQVAKFVGEISDLAETNDLEESKYESGEQIEKVQEEIDEELKKETAAIINIPATSQYLSEFDNIEAFLFSLYNKDDFIMVSALDMQGGEAREYLASRQEARGEAVTIDTTLPYYSWTMKVTFEKYQFSSGFNNYLLENLVPITAEPNNEILVYIRNRYS